MALSNNLRRGVAEYIEEIDTERQLPSSYLSDIKKNNIKYYELYDEDVYKTTKTKRTPITLGWNKKSQH